MGIKNLAALAKVVAGVPVDLNEGQGREHVIIDGGYMNHRMCTRRLAASSLLLKDDVRPHVEECAKQVRMFEDRGYIVTVVFDGSSPPAKAGTSSTRRARRESYAAQARDLHGRDPSKSVQINTLSSQACVFDSRVNARIALHLRTKIQGEVYVAPVEADPQVVVFQNIRLESGAAKVYVLGNDSDYLVLGVKLLLHEVTLYRGNLSGRVIKAGLIFKPTAWSLKRVSPEHAWLRQLHGLPKEARDLDPVVLPKPFPEAIARERLLLFGIVVGNDFADFKNVGTVAAARIVLSTPPPDTHGVDAAHVPFDARVGELAEGLVVASKEGDTLAARVEAARKLRKCHALFVHGVVWNPFTGCLQHASGSRCSEDITTHTGTLALSPMANQIAQGDVDARTGQEWSPPLEEIPPCSLRQRRGGGRQGAGAAPAGRKRRCGRPATPPFPPPAPNGRKKVSVPDNRNNYNSHGFNKLPDADERYSKWTVLQLREFLSAMRCLDNAGTSGYNKALLVNLATDVVRVIRESGVVGKNLAFRHPVPDLRSFEEKEKATMPELPAVCRRITEWVALRRYIPEISKSVIVEFLQEVNPAAGESTRVFYRAQQRALDMGNLSRLWGVPSKDGDMWLGTSAGASFSGDKEYRVRIHLRTEELHEDQDPDAMEEEEEQGGSGEARNPTKSVIALKVVAALCECPAGLSGGCSHVAMVLLLCRLLHMGDHELATFNPSTCTGRACAWIMQHSEGSRSTDHCFLYGKPLTESTSIIRGMRDPRREVGGSDEEAEGGRLVKTRGVTTEDRMHGFNPHPSGGRWARPKRHFDAGIDLSRHKRDKLMEFVDCEADSVDRQVCLDFLPPLEREDSST